MTTLAGVLLLICAAPAGDLSAADSARAAAIIDEYMALPLSSEGLLGEHRGARVVTLRKLIDVGEAAVPAVAAALSPALEVERRVELLEALSWIPSRRSAALLIRYLHNPAAKVRRQAIRGLYRFSARLRPPGEIAAGGGLQRSAQVDGLEQYLIAAARDEDAENRALALTALVATGDSIAVPELRRALQDGQHRVRVEAACLLSKFGDDYGLYQLRMALEDATSPRAARRPGRYFEAEDLIASFQRLTGVELGRIPPQPAILSSMAASKAAEQEYDALLLKWQQWWLERDATTDEATAARDAETTLVDFLSALARGDYESAVALYGGSYGTLQDWNPRLHPDQKAELWKAGCSVNGLHCCELRRILGRERRPNGAYRFSVELTTPGGELLVIGPCCGEDPATSPPVSSFHLDVARVGRRFKVLGSPPFSP